MLLHIGSPIKAPKTKNWTRAPPLPSIDDSKASETADLASTILSMKRPTTPLGPVSLSSASGSAGSSGTSTRGPNPLSENKICWSHCARSRCASSRSSTGFWKAMAFPSAPLTAATHSPLVAAALNSSFVSNSDLKAWCQLVPLASGPWRSQKHSQPLPACCDASLQASRKRRNAFLDASSEPSATDGTKKMATQAQFPSHSPLQRSWKDLEFSSGRIFPDLACSAI
mmetsp:Transcript_83442/g.232748  ORF Transcript_83442/g.232748 Transcript_83442/m.232748 type:complete len:227 (-) Transcript_83442:1067-1747(-)